MDPTGGVQTKIWGSGRLTGAATESRTVARDHLVTFATPQARASASRALQRQTAKAEESGSDDDDDDDSEGVASARPHTGVLVAVALAVFTRGWAMFVI